MGASVRKEGVLVGGEGAAVVALVCGLGGEGGGLGAFAVCVLLGGESAVGFRVKRDENEGRFLVSG